MLTHKLIIPVLLSLVVSPACVSVLADTVIEEIFASEHFVIKATTLLDGLNHPWSLNTLDDDRLLISERNGKLICYNIQTNTVKTIQGLPNFHMQGQGGLLGITKDINFDSNGLLFIAYTGKNGDGIGTEVLRAKLKDDQLINQSVIFKALPKSKGGRHFGGRVIQDAQRNLYITLGDRGDRDRAQDLSDHAGSLIRIRPDGTIPVDNPWINERNIQPEIYTYGNRNIQGITISSDQQQIWMHEHGPQGGDELNIVAKGANYGWPVITYGREYVIGTRIGEGTEKPGMVQPVYYWVPSIAPSGMTFYSGKLFTTWKSDLLLGSLKFGLLVRLTIENDQVIHEERMLNGDLGRIRDVSEHTDGSILLLTDEKNGRLIRLTPVIEK